MDYRQLDNLFFCYVCNTHVLGIVRCVAFSVSLACTAH